MPNTYVALRTETLVSAASSVTFSLSGISGYTDLVMIINGGLTTNNQSFRWQFNGDTASNYSYTYIAGNGSTASSSRASNASGINAYHVSGQSDSGLKSNVIFHLQNYANTTTNKTCLIRGNTDLETAATVGLWRNTAAITSILVATTNGNIQAGTTLSLYGIANADQGTAKATGGIITEDSQYWYHTFGASGAFIPKQSLTCDVLVVAGGGGTSGQAGGGGGAGGLLVQTGRSVPVATYNITVGAGGPGSANNNTNGSVGSNSVFDTSTALGGGFGGSANATTAGGNGGSGGGASYNGTVGGTATQGNSGGATGYGFAGGIGFGSGTQGAGGGGGAGAVGAAGANAVGGNGGIGRTDSLINAIGAATGLGQLVSSNYYFAGGGGGAVVDNTIGSGGAGGGGNGGNFNTGSPNGTVGLVNTGGGGGGRGTAGAGFAGGSGVVVIRYSK